MLNDATCFKQIYIVTGYTDLRFGLDSLASIIESKSGRSPYVPDTLYLFCGRKTDRIKGLVWEKDGFLLLTDHFSQKKGPGDFHTEIYHIILVQKVEILQDKSSASFPLF